MQAGIVVLVQETFILPIRITEWYRLSAIHSATAVLGGGVTF
jgi:hypothetical protein